MNFSDLLIATMLGITSPGSDRALPSVLTGPWPVVAMQEKPRIADIASANRFFREDDYLTLRCELRFDPAAQLDNGPQNVRLFVAAHELGHCFDESRVPTGVSMHAWKELFADIWAALALKSSGVSLDHVLRQRPHLKPYIMALRSEIAKAPHLHNVQDITAMASEIRARLLNPKRGTP